MKQKKRKNDENYIGGTKSKLVLMTLKIIYWNKEMKNLKLKK